MKCIVNATLGQPWKIKYETGPPRNSWHASNGWPRAIARPTSKKSSSVRRSAWGESEPLQQYAIPGTSIRGTIRGTQVQARALISSHELVPSAQRSTIAEVSFLLGTPTHSCVGHTQLCMLITVFSFVLFELFSFTLPPSSLPPHLPYWKCGPNHRAINGCLRGWSSHHHQRSYDTS